MKKRLHPYLAGHDSCHLSGNEKFYGGRINLFGLELDISWNGRESSWNIESLSVMSDEEMQTALSGLENALSHDNVLEVFGDEKEVLFGDIKKEEKFFWDKSGRRWMVGSGKDCLSGWNVCIEVRGLGDCATGEVRHFGDDSLVYIYPENK